MFTNYTDFESKKCMCRECPVGPVYNKVVCSVGNKIDPTFMIIGEAPGKDEVEKGEPFVGKSGKTLREYLILYKFSKKNTIITNTIPCRPLDNMFPTDNETVPKCVSRWLMYEIALLKPKYILLVGGQAMRHVLQTNESVTKTRGKVIDHCFSLPPLDPPNLDEFSDVRSPYIKCLVTFHPSYVLRKENMSEGKIVREQFKSDIELFSKLPEIGKTILTF